MQMGLKEKKLFLALYLHFPRGNHCFINSVNILPPNHLCAPIKKRGGGSRRLSKEYVVLIFLVN